MDAVLTLQEQVQEIIAVFTGADKVFTAFDVTMALRARLTEPVRHSEVKEFVFEEWKNVFCDEYESTLTELKIGGKTVNAYVYHPETVDATTHPLAVKEEVENDNTVVDIQTVNIPYRTVELTSCEKRLSIPKEMLKRLGLVAGQFVSLDITDPRKMVIKKDGHSSKDRTVLSINADGRLRINKAELNKIFDESTEEFNVFLIEDKEIIEVIPV